MAKSLNEWRDEIKQWAVSKGWDEEGTPDPEVLKSYVVEKLLLIHTEVSEATEELRKLRLDPDTPREYLNALDALRRSSRTPGTGKPEGFASEIIDTIIRCLQLCGALEIDVDREMKLKMEYNAGRPYRHGKNM